MDRPLRLISRDTIAESPIDALARTVEALLVVASQPLTVEQLADATEDDAERVETALGLLSERYREGRSGIVLERVSGGYAFRAGKISPRRWTGHVLVTRGQLEYEWRHLCRKLARRSRPDLRAISHVTRPRAHPLFRVVPGPVAQWERMS